MNYQYLPEMQGITQNEQQNYMNNMQQGRDRMNKSNARSGIQSGGAYMDAISNLNAKQGQGLSAIERENIYKNALLGREERLTKEAYQRQKDWLDYQNNAAYNQSGRMLDRQNSQNLATAIPNFLGGVAGRVVNSGLNYLTGGISNVLGGKDFNSNPQNDYNDLVMEYLKSQTGGSETSKNTMPYSGADGYKSQIDNLKINY